MKGFNDINETVSSRHRGHMCSLHEPFQSTSIIVTNYNGPLSENTLRINDGRHIIGVKIESYHIAEPFNC